MIFSFSEKTNKHFPSSNEEKETSQIPRVLLRGKRILWVINKKGRKDITRERGEHARCPHFRLVVCIPRH